MNLAIGDMYSWVTHTWNPLNGECGHACKYCYVKNTPAGRMGFYSGALRLNKRAMKENLGKGKTIFICSLNDLFADVVPAIFIKEILDRCWMYPGNNYVFQTKNPARYKEFVFPDKSLLGCTIESNIEYQSISCAPIPHDRMWWMCEKKTRKFVTIEPILRMDVDIMIRWMRRIRPEFVNIGADSKRSGLPEPSKKDVLALIEGLKKVGIEVRQKSNLGRLLK